MATSSDSLPIATMIHMVTIKLSSHNYLLWKRQVLPMLTSFDLLGFVNGTRAAPPATISSSGESVPNPAHAQWLSTDQRLLGVLFSTLSEEAMAEVVDCTTSRDAWTSLESSFSHSSISRVHQLREELLSLRRGSLSVKEYGTRFKSLCDQLSAIGKPVDDSDKSHWFLRGLGTQFANFTDTRMVMPCILSFSVLLHQAIQFDMMSKAMDSAEPSPPVAFAAAAPSPLSPSRQSTTNSSNNGGRSTQQNNSSGHNNRSGNGGRSGGRGPPRKPRCQICRGEHYADKCPLYLGRVSSTPANLAEAFTSSCNVSGSSSDWFVDSGASAHMTSDPSTLDASKPYSGNGSVVVGNGHSLSISHTGSTCLIMVFVFLMYWSCLTSQKICSPLAN